jgi:peptidoglycan/xylan/chitin deacetylase (PgdA/CDA1 family)
MKNGSIALRMDDVGASSKKYEVYSNHQWQIGRARISANWLFLKYLPAFKAWGPYPELIRSDWEKIIDLLQKHKAKLTVAVTAAWVEGETRITPFPQAFPTQAAIIKEACQHGLVEVANHGLSHCVVKGNAFRPKLLSGNREAHREFGPSVPLEVQEDHIQRSQEILQSWLGAAVVTFVPPGNLFSEQTLGLAAQNGLKYVSCNAHPNWQSDPVILGNENTAAFHDRDLVLGSETTFEEMLIKFKDREFVTVRELAEERLGSNGR